jgi:hypothetical protein
MHICVFLIDQRSSAHTLHAYDRKDSCYLFRTIQDDIRLEKTTETGYALVCADHQLYGGVYATKILFRF